MKKFTPDVIMIDFDGTLVDSIDQLRIIYFEFMEKNGLHVDESDFKKMMGSTVKEIVAGVVEKNNDTSLQSQGNELLEFYRKRLLNAYASHIQPMPRAVDFLIETKKRNIAAVLVTAAEKSFVMPLLKRCNLEHYFQFLVTAESADKGKPDPALYQCALNLGKWRSGQAIAIEDSESGVKSATSAEIYTFWMDRAKANEHGKNWRGFADWNEMFNLMHWNEQRNA